MRELNVSEQTWVSGGVEWSALKPSDAVGELMQEVGVVLVALGASNLIFFGVGKFQGASYSFQEVLNRKGLLGGLDMGLGAALIYWGYQNGEG